MSSFDCYSTSAITTLKDAPYSGSSNRNDYHGDSNKRKRRNVLVLRDDDSNINDEDKKDEDDYLVMCDVLDDLWLTLSSYEPAKYETILQAMKDFAEVNKLDGLFPVTKLKISRWVNSIILSSIVRLDCLEVFHACIYGNIYKMLLNLISLIRNDGIPTQPHFFAEIK
jgi:hypothetical protein